MRRRITFREACAYVVMHQNFDYLSATLVVVNAICIGVQTNIAGLNRGEKERFGLRVMDVFFCFAFTLELVLRLLVFRWKFFYNSSWRWNMFDFIIILLNLLEEISAVLATHVEIPDFSFMRILRVLRLVRIMRLVRVMKLIVELRMLVTSILNSMRSLAWTVVLLFLIVYSTAVYLVGMVSTHANGHMPSLQLYWGDLGTGILTLFECITGGIDWHDAVEH